MLFKLFSRKARTLRNRASARRQLELLEDQVTPAVLNHGGPIIANVQAQALYLGADWIKARLAIARNRQASLDSVCLKNPLRKSKVGVGRFEIEILRVSRPRFKQGSFVAATAGGGELVVHRAARLADGTSGDDGASGGGLL